MLPGVEVEKNTTQAQILKTAERLPWRESSLSALKCLNSREGIALKESEERSSCGRDKAKLVG